jgi:AmmeMemoRadiSam system protein A
MPSLSETDRRSLLELARRAVVDAVANGKLPELIPHEGIFAERHGVFVTLHIEGRLRGCIGVVEPDERLGEAVIRCAASAALEDPRFPSVRSEELAALRIELSLLSPASPIARESIEIGCHGLLVTLGKHRGLLLPQVALEHRLDAQRFLEETCRKAGLPREAASDPQLQIFGFTCQVFAEGPQTIAN